MKTLNNKLMAIGSLAILAVIGTLMNSPQAAMKGAGGGPTVTIDPTQLPLLVKDVGGAPQIPFALTLNKDDINVSFGQWTVPATQRLVIEGFSASCSVDTTATMTDIELRVVTGGTVAFAYVAPHFGQPSGSISGHAVNYWTGSALTRHYADPGSIIRVGVMDSSGDFLERRCTFGVSGYAVQVP